MKWVCKDPPGHRARRVRLALPVSPDRRVKRAHKGLRARPVHKVQPGRKACLACKVPPGHRARRVLRAQAVPRVPRGHKAKPVRRVQMLDP